MTIAGSRRASLPAVVGVSKSVCGEAEESLQVVRMRLFRVHGWPAQSEGSKVRLSVSSRDDSVHAVSLRTHANRSQVARARGPHVAFTPNYSLMKLPN
jgi:hypothetical protein